MNTEDLQKIINKTNYKYSRAIVINSIMDDRSARGRPITELRFKPNKHVRWGLSVAPDLGG